MSKILTINNVHAYIDGNGVAQLNLEDCARGLGFTEKAASGNETIRWRTVKSYLSSFNTIATTCDDVPDFIPENIFYRLAMKAKNETAEKFGKEHKNVLRDIENIIGSSKLSHEMECLNGLVRRCIHSK